MAASRHDDLEARLRAANVARRQDDAFFDALAEHAAASEEAPARQRPTAARITAAALGTGLLLSGGVVASAYMLINSDGHHRPEPQPATILQPSVHAPPTDDSAGGGRQHPSGSAGTPQNAGGTPQADGGRGGQSAHADDRPGHRPSDRSQPPGNAYGVHGQTPQGHAHGHGSTTPPGHAYGHDHTDHGPPANAHAHHGRPTTR